MTFNLLFLRCSFKYLQTGLSHDEAALFMTVKKGQSPFLTKGLQSAARIICSLKANKFHTCRLRSVFCDVHAQRKSNRTRFQWQWKYTYHIERYQRS